MDQSGGYGQGELDALWEALGGDDPPAEAMRIVDDDEQQVMSVLTDEGQLVVRRPGPGGTWERVA